jgi:hypothetical protein
MRCAHGVMMRSSSPHTALTSVLSYVLAGWSNEVDSRRGEFVICTKIDGYMRW